MNSISVVVVSYNEEDSIGSCLESLLAQTYEYDFEILVIDNGSTDTTMQIVESFAHEHKKIRLLHNPRKGIVFSRNMGIRQSTSPFLAYTDADCLVPKDWLSKLMKGYVFYKNKYPALCGVGGGNEVALPENTYSRALKIFLQSYLGSHGSANGKIYTADRVIDHLPTTNILYEKAVLLTHPFDETMVFGGSDLEITSRLRSLGYIFMYLKGATVLHKREPSVLKWSKSMFRYGRGRIFAMTKNRLLQEPHMILPMLVIASLIIIPLGCIHYLFFFPFLLYLFVIVFFSLWAGLRTQLYLSPMLFLLSIVTHMCFGLGEWYESFRILKRHFS